MAFCIRRQFCSLKWRSTVSTFMSTTNSKSSTTPQLPFGSTNQCFVPKRLLSLTNLLRSEAKTSTESPTDGIILTDSCVERLKKICDDDSYLRIVVRTSSSLILRSVGSCRRGHSNNL